jgi:prevent-host-death family protein
MKTVYSTYEAKAKFSEVLRRVRAGKNVIIAYRGEEIAEIRPLEKSNRSLEESLSRLEADGILSPVPKRVGSIKAHVKRRGALARFLESRE